ncbi:MAG: DAK2 domain-containing protein, partial [Dehalococcoidales bacterium]|nr:DAK2 domain-containing protein [Dehalococcoidales bacterium]
GDTGTNMLLTMHSAMEEAHRSQDGNASSVAQTIAHGALMGARGNSGVILSQFWKGFAKGLNGNQRLSSKALARALSEASEAAYEGLVNPVEGTMLTVLRDSANAAEAAAKANSRNLTKTLATAMQAARESVANTPNLLPVLREAGVVDAGGQGLYVLLEGALHYLRGENDTLKHGKPRLIPTSQPLAPGITQMPAEVEVPYGYCMNFLLEGQDLNLKKIKKNLKKKGQSLVITGNSSRIRVHIHSFKPGEIIDYATKQGVLHKIKIDNMDDQYAAFIKMQRKKLPPVDIAIVAVASGEGLFKLFRSLGTTIIIPGGQTMNPSVRELVEAVDSAPSNKVILLPNNKNIVVAASQVQSLTSKDVKVVPTKTIPQGIGALLSFNYDMDLENNASAMAEALNRVKSIEITKAVRKSQINSMNIKKGEFIAVLDDKELVANGKKVKDVITNALEKADVKNAELVSIYYGAETKPAEARKIADEIQNEFSVEVETVQGDQPYYNYIISLE